MPFSSIMHHIIMRQLIAILYQPELPASVHEVKFIVLVNVLSE